ncbi:regulator of chromosome condensation-like isoform X2 [Hyposmocoma kahamanoa]|uniref:regulator of chromosome condensation-like isoform X2 n=1 Tax=Hyposmocoma kahamanoa TaxID=1477025 RepID=UPI000E6D89A4|nr:regulator of chromosome condensation-like isoform X2 [Hyposmocoma kahamanoa]
MPAARGVKRTASKSSSSAASATPKNKKKRNVIQLEVPTAPKKRGRVLTCGQGDVGQLGLGEDVIETNKFKQVPGLGDKIVDVCAGGMHTVALDSDGKIWTFGCNDEGALGRTTSGEADEGTPKKVTLPLPAVAIAAGDSHSAALLNNGDVFAWGSFRDSHGSMGLVVRGREGKACREPVKLDIGEPAAGIASGGDHLVVLSTSGSVYTMGCGEQGQLGRLSQRSASRDTRQGFSALLVPSKVTLKGGASRVWAGYHATFILDGGQDKVIAWGLNNYGQLGVTGEKRKTALFSPTECDAFTATNVGWKSVACGQHHSLALDTSGQVYAIGRCEYGRLGLGSREGDAEALEPIPLLQSKKCISIAAGTSSSFAVTDTGEVLAWGMGSEGQLGTGASEDAAEPRGAVCQALGDLRPSNISAGGQHTVLLAEDPSSQKEASPVPEKETAEKKADEVEEMEEEEPEPEKPKPKGRATKRQKKQEQDEEISSTSSAQPSEISDESKPQKVNGDEKKETPMEVDETDKPQEKKDNTTPKDEQKTIPETEMKEEPKPETTDTSSQGTIESKSEDSQDIEMTEEKPVEKIVEDKKQEEKKPVEKVPEEKKPVENAQDEKQEVNGTEEDKPEKSETIEVKTVVNESVNEPALTTTA